MAWAHRTLKTFKILKNIKIVKQHRGQQRFSGEKKPGLVELLSNEIYFNKKKDRGLGKDLTEAWNSILTTHRVTIKLARHRDCPAGDGHRGQGRLKNKVDQRDLCRDLIIRASLCHGFCIDLIDGNQTIK